MIEFSVLASGSNGNCSYVKYLDKLILIDCGISYKKTKEALLVRNINISKVTDIIITHAHYDHYMSLTTFIKKNNPIIHVTHKIKGDLDQKGNIIFDGQIKFLKPDRRMGNIIINYFTLPHDKITIGLTMKCGNCKISYATDFGHATKLLINNLLNSDLIVIEANHDIDMVLENEEYPSYIKERILGPKGHISNLECFDIIKKVYSERTKHIICAHMSQKNNKKEKILEVFGKLYGLYIADQETGTPILIMET